MDTARGWGDNFFGSELVEVEARLAKVLVPVEPNPDYVHNLKQRLLTSSDIAVERPSSGILRTIFFVFASLASGTFLVILGIKGVRHIRETASMQNMKNGKSTAAV
ncbi:MAG: hypothetical protein EHM41_07360 [Chloroflexi bacterium]|nr:MAG: hypothetical protein EHM41_07360 [Chloroflexota bacterium]